MLLAVLLINYNNNSTKIKVSEEQHVSTEKVEDPYYYVGTQSDLDEILKSKSTVYSGFIYGDCINDIQMTLEFNDNNVSGYYRYDYYYAESQDLTGTINDKTMELVANDGSIKFVGTLEGLKFSGKWYTVDGSNTFDVYNESIPKEKTETLFGQTGDLSLELFSTAGTRSTTLNIEEDGSFSGVYSDLEKGRTSSEYPNGTKNYLEFSGQFEVKKKIDDYTYLLLMRSFDQGDVKLGTEHYIDGYRYIYTYPYGLKYDNEFILCLPGKPRNELSEDVLDWDEEYKFSNEKTSTLTYYALYGVKSEIAFYSKLK